MDTIEWTSIILALTNMGMIFLTLLIIGISFWYYRKYFIDHRDGLIADIQLKCLRQYLSIQKERRISKDDEFLREKAEDYFRSLFDLHYTEFHLWKQGYINDDCMRDWLDIRYRNYTKEDSIQISENEKVTYKETWLKFVSDEYFYPDDNSNFVKMMRKVHENKIEKAMEEFK